MATITQINPDKFSIQDYTFEDYDIVPNFEVTSLYKPETGHIEFFIYDANSNLLDEDYNFSTYSFTEDPSITNLGGYSTINLDPEQSLIDKGFDVGQYNVVYNFFENQLGSSSDLTFYVKEISSDRTELRLSSNNLTVNPTEFASFVDKLQGEDYFNEFYLNFGKNRILIAINTQLDNSDVLVKLYEPLPSIFSPKSTCWIELKISDPIAYNVSLIQDIQVTETIPFLKGPNTNIQIKDEINNSTELKSYEELILTNVTSSYQQINNLLKEKGIEISVDYTDFSNFVHFSSAEQRLLNFYEKVSLIESCSNQLNTVDNAITGSTSASYYVSESKASLQNIIDNTIANFDGYEYYLYFESSSYAWPKQNSQPPYVLYSTGSTQALDWIGNSNENAGNSSPSTIYPYGRYGGLALSASLYDNDNQNNLTKTIPEFILNDTQNDPYLLFIEMMGQHFDSIWIYTKDITNKFNADNRLNYGISKDFVAQAIRDFGLKIYQNQFSTDDLYSAFLGITPSGSLLPSTGSELIETYVTASSDVTPLDDVNKAIYKRLYHNLPYLLNKKGTIQGIKALIASYGIPNTILRVSEFGGKDRDNSNDWDYWYNKFGYSFYTSGSTFLSSSFSLNSDWGAVSDVPGAIEFRFKSDGIPVSSFSQSLWSTDGGVELQLLYEGSGSASGSYSGSVVDPYNTYGYLNFYPNYALSTANSASVYLPFFDEGWWSVLVNSSSAGYELFAKNKIYIGDDASLLGFQASSSLAVSETNWGASTLSYFASGSQTIFSGSLQEVRYYKTALSESVFDDYVMNQLSAEGNSLNSAPLDLVFRAPLGSELNTGSLESVHPKITGSWTVTQSFASDSNFAFSATPTFVPGTEYIFLDQPAAGIKNRITDKVRIGDQILPTGSNQVLSQYRSIEQQLPLSQSYTPSINLLEVAFSPQNEINDDIIEQIGYFNLGQYIGDPRYISSSRTDYEDLSRLSNEYFQKYTHNYDVWDYIRLIKYFDNSLFKMIKDFVPAKTSLQSGVVIKQHLLERNRYPQPQVSHSFHYYSGSIEVGSIEGGAGGSVNNLNYLANNPYEQSIGTELPSGTLVTGLTQSYSESLDTIAGIFNVIDSTQQEFYNGEYSGSTLTATTQSLNPGCWVYLHGLPTSYNYSSSVFNTTSSAVTEARFIDPVNTLMKTGFAYFLFDGTNVSKVRISKTDGDGNYLGTQLANLTSISTISELGNITYTFAGNAADLGSDYIYSVANTVGTPTYTSNNILDMSFGVNHTSFVDNFSGSKTMSIDEGPQSGFPFYPLDISNITTAGDFYVTRQPTNRGLPTSSIYEVTSGEFFNRYVNDSLLNSGSISFNSTWIDTRTSGWGGTAMFGLLAESQNTNRNYLVFESSSMLTIAPNTAQDFEFDLQSSGISEIEFPSSAENSVKYYFGFVLRSGPGTPIPEFEIRNWNFVVQQQNFPVQLNGALSYIPESSYPSGFQNSDCDVLQGNSEDDRESGFWMDVDYSTNNAIAVNSSTILANTAPKADVQDSNYTLARHINPRYNGSRTTSEYINNWTSGSSNTYGKLAVADQEKTYFAYFDFINGLSPELKGKTIAHIQFLIDEEGNAIPPDDSKLYITQGTFKTGEKVFVNLNDPLRFEVPMNQLNGIQTVVRGGSRVDALLYSDSGSSYTSSIYFDTGSFPVTNYQFSTINSAGSTNITDGVNLYNGWDYDTVSNAQWSNSTDTFTFSNDTDSPVKFKARVDARLLGAGGILTVYIVKNWSSGVPTTSQILASDSQGGGGTFTWTFNLETGYLNFQSGDTVKLIYYSQLSGGPRTWNNGLLDTFSSYNQINPNGYITAPYWEYNRNLVSLSGGTWITGSTEVSAVYGARQLDIIPYDGAVRNPEFDPLIQDFTVKVGDEIRFLGSEPYAYMVKDIIYPENAADGKLKLKLDDTLNNLPNAITGSLDHFLLRRYVDDASYIILDSKKPMGSTSPGTIKPEFVTDLLDQNFSKATEDAIKSIT